MKKFCLLILLFTFLASLEIDAQRTRRFINRGASVVGTVKDSTTNEVIEYAYVILFNKKNDEMVSSDVTDRTGLFELTRIKPGKYYLTVQFMGYKLFKYDGLDVKSGSGKMEIGDIKISQDVLLMEDVEITAENPAMTYKIDKKVINVEQQSTAISGTAVDVLENVPSITVDIDGNVALRGSSNFIVLIDNRPTILEANDILQQMPASSIKNIEIITNPSAKFDPDGNAGILNIITKKGERSGFNGIMNLKGGLENKYGTNFVFNYRVNSSEYYFGADYNDSRYPGSGTSLRRSIPSGITNPDTTFFRRSSGNSDRGRESYGIRAGANLSLSENDNIYFGTRYGKFGWGGESDEIFQEWTEPVSLSSYYVSNEESERSGIYFTANAGFQHFFSKGHTLTAEAVFSTRSMDEYSLDNLLDSLGVKASGRETTEEGPRERSTFKLDYVYPINDSSKFEAGYQSRLRNSEEISKMGEYNVSTSQYEYDPQFQNTLENVRNIHSVYSIYSNKFGNLGYQLGLRGEYTYRDMKLKESQESFVIDRFDLFPSIHTSYSITKMQQFMVSYTRRIHRPRGWNLQPFLTWFDAYNVRTGNPDLLPEYIDSYELGYHNYFGSNLFSIEVYYRVTNNRVDRVQKDTLIQNTEVTLHTSKNVGKDYMLGAEIGFNFDPVAWWDVNLMSNLYDYKIEGVLFNDPFSRSSFNWNLRFNNSFILNKETRIQFNGHYNSPTVSSQGERQGRVSFNVAVRRDFFNKSLTATLQIRDVFKTAKHESTSITPTSYLERSRFRNAPVVMLNLRYNINNAKQKRERPDAEDLEDYGEQF